MKRETAMLEKITGLWYNGAMKIGVILPAGMKEVPNKIEFSAAFLLAEFFQTKVKMVPRNSGHTPDFEINGKLWELKSPLGNSKHTMEHQFSRANKQAIYLVLDARRSKMTMAKIRRLAIFEFRQSKTIKRLVIIDKQSRVVEIPK